MTENASSPIPDHSSAERATWAVNSLLEAGDDELAAELAAALFAELSAEAELRTAA